MRVGIDARKLADFGIGTYIRGLLGGLVSLGSGDEYIAFAPASAAIPPAVANIVEHIVYVGTNVIIGDHVQVMPTTSVGHDSVVWDFATICPACTERVAKL